MDSLLQAIGAMIIWGLLPASLHVFIQLQMARTAHRRHLAKRRLKEWRTRVPYVTPNWPRRAYMDTACQDEGVLWYVSTCREDALRQEVTTCAQRALNSAPHIHN